MITSHTSVKEPERICSRGRPLVLTRVFVIRRSFALMIMGLVGCAGPTGSTVHVSPPSIATQPTNQTVTAGQTATFTVVSAGTAPLSYQWQKNGANIAGAASASYTTAATTTSDSGAKFD